MSDLIRDYLTDIALFARVVEAGGFTAASKLVDVPQSTLSRRVAALEARLGTRLLNRTTRKVSATEAGNRVYKHAKRILDEVESVEAVAASLREEPAGLVRITAPVVFGQHLLSPAIAGFLSKYPKVRFQTELTGRRVDVVDEGFDIAIRVGDLEESSLVKIPLTRANAAYYATESVARRIVAPKDLAAANWLHPGLTPGVAEWRLIDPASQSVVETLTKEPCVTGSEIQVLIDVAKAGLGVAVLPEFAAPPKLTRVLPQFLARQVDINALVVSRKSIVPAIREFLNHLKDKVSEKRSASGS